MHVILSFASGIVCLVAYVPYILNILKGHTKPERMSWLLWLILGVISFFAQASLGATFSLVLPAVLTLGSLIIFMLSIKYGIGGTLRRDIVALVVSMSGLGVWILYNKPLVPLLINIAIGSVSALLTMFKAREHPNTETSLTWLLASIAGLLSLSSVKNLEFSLVAYPAYIVITNFAVYVSTARK
jgi:hypothetical protein